MEAITFPDKDKMPVDEELRNILGSVTDIWFGIKQMVHEKYPKATDEWNYGGKKYGWHFRIKDKKRAILYFLPSHGYFMVAFVFGQKATDAILNSDIDESIKTDLLNARVYAEGRGIRIEIRDESLLGDISKLTDIKLAH